MTEQHDAPDEAVLTHDASALRAELHRSTAAMDEGGFVRDLTTATNLLGVERSLTMVLLPFLKELGEQWEAGARSVGHEHFATNIVRRYIDVLRWSAGHNDGPSAVLACPPGERHEIGLVCVDLVLARRGWRVHYLGANTPMRALASVSLEVAADAVVVSATHPKAIESRRRQLRTLGRHHQLAIGGAGANPEVAATVGALLLPQDVVAAADLLDTQVRGAVGADIA